MNCLLFFIFFLDYAYDGGHYRRTCQNGKWSGQALHCLKTGFLYKYCLPPQKIIVSFPVKKKIKFLC